MSKKLSSFLVAMLAAVALGAVPAVSQAETQFLVNGKPQGTTPENVNAWGTVTMNSPYWGELTCKIIVGVPVWNEATEGRPVHGIAAVKGWEPFVCHANMLRGKVYISAETSVELIERENTHKEKVFEAKRGVSTMPWPSQPVLTPEGTRVLQIGQTEKVPVEPIKFSLNAPEELFEVQYEGTLRPRWINGTKNGLKPSHIEFEGEGGKSGLLRSPTIFGGKEPQSLMFIRGELSMVGAASQQLVTVE